MIKSKFELQFQQNRINYWASRYNYSEGEPQVTALGKSARQKGFLTDTELLQFFMWKTGGRGQSRCKKNVPEHVKELTGISFKTTNERLQVEILTLLDGVQWPVASTILHFVFPEKYTILDFRALWSLGIDKTPVYNYQFWKAYTATCRSLAATNNVDLRTLDRALWQYSKENQTE